MPKLHQVRPSNHHSNSRSLKAHWAPPLGRRNRWYQTVLWVHRRTRRQRTTARWFRQYLLRKTQAGTAGLQTRVTEANQTQLHQWHDAALLPSLHWFRGRGRLAAAEGRHCSQKAVIMAYLQAPKYFFYPLFYFVRYCLQRTFFRLGFKTSFWFLSHNTNEKMGNAFGKNKKPAEETQAPVKTEQATDTVVAQESEV